MFFHKLNSIFVSVLGNKNKNLVNVLNLKPSLANNKYACIARQFM